MEEFEEERIDWGKKFEEFVDLHVKNHAEKQLIMNYFSLAKRKGENIKPDDVFHLYENVFKDLKFEEVLEE